MSDSEIDVIGIDNAIMDIFATPEDDQILTSLGISKGGTYLVDGARAGMLASCLHASKVMSGGTVANTIFGIKSFGASAGFIGKVGEDIYGERFVFELREKGIKTAMYYAVEITTSQCFVIVGKDGVRTMMTYIDPQSYITKDDIDLGILEKAKIIYLSGYMLDYKEGVESAKTILDFAKAKGKKVAITLSSQLCASKHQKSFLGIIDNYANFVFANTAEINILFGTKTIDEAIRIMLDKSQKKDCIFAIGDSDNPSLVIQKGVLTTSPRRVLSETSDKTGYGSAFASGILYGYLQGYPMQQCADLGNAAAEEVISNLGARPASEFVLLLDPKQRGVNIKDQQSNAW